MKNTNKYGFYSAGYVFDRADRYALRTLNNACPETKDEIWTTANCNIDYKKQLCTTDATHMRAITIQKLGDSALIGVEFIQGKSLIATAYVNLIKTKP